MSDDDYTVEARELLKRDEVDLIDLDAGERRIAKVSGLEEGDVWLQYRDEGEPRSVAARTTIHVRPAT